MSARRLSRLLGSVLTLAALTTGALLADDSLTLSTFGFDWSASFDGETVNAPVDAMSQIVHYGPVSGVV